MITTHHSKLESIIQDQHLKSLINQANKIKNANQQLIRFLPPPLDKHIIVSNIKGNTLILQTNSPAWSTRTNFIATEIVNYMRNEGGLAMIDRIKVKVVPQQIENISRRRTVESLSYSTAELLKSVASGAKSEDLADVLNRIAENFKPEQK